MKPSQPFISLRRSGPCWMAVLALLTAAGCATAGHAGSRAATSTIARHMAPARASTTSASAGHVSVLRLPASDAPGGYRSVWVYRPDVPDSAQLPVLYFLTGQGGKATQLADNMPVRAWLDAAFRDNRMHPFVVVAPGAQSRFSSDPEWGNSTDGRVREESFVTGELIAAVEGAHRRDRLHRAIAGVSMGGFGAINLAQRHPDLYGQAAEVGGYFRLDDPQHVFGFTRATQDANRPDVHVERLRHTRLLLADGSADHDAPSAGELQRFAGLLRADGQRPDVITVPGYPHGWATLIDIWPAIVTFLEAGWR